MINVIFVCLGNICRSPMADAVFQQMVKEAGLSAQISVDSAGTGSWHIGEKPHRGTQRVLAEHNIPYNGRARRITTNDIGNPTNYIIVMDQSNYNDVVREFGQHPRLHRLMEFATDSNEINVPDAYYTGNFDYVYELITDGCHGLLATIRQENGL